MHLIISHSVTLDLALHCCLSVDDYGRQTLEIMMKDQLYPIYSEVTNLWYPGVGCSGEVGRWKGLLCVSYLTLLFDLALCFVLKAWTSRVHNRLYPTKVRENIIFPII